MIRTLLKLETLPIKTLQKKIFNRSTRKFNRSSDQDFTKTGDVTDQDSTKENI